MALTVSTSPTKKTDNGRVEDGPHMARVVQIIDLGMQKQTDWKTGEVQTYDDGNPIIKPEVFITYEFPTDRIEIDGESKPRWLSKRYTMSLHEKSALTALITAVDPAGAKGKSYDLSKLIDKPLMVTVGSTSNGNPKVTSVSGIPKGIKVDPLENDSRLFDMGSFDMEVYESLPNFIQEIIQNSESFKGFPKSAKPNKEELDDVDDDAPF